MSAIHRCARVVPAVILAGGVLAAALATSTILSAQSDGRSRSKSEPFATELAKLLTESNLTNLAAKNGDRYVAVLYVPGTQLIVVSGKFTGAERMSYLISQKSYQDAYLDLSGASEQTSRVLITDLGADGLHFGRAKDQPFDMVMAGGQAVAFDRVVRNNDNPSSDEYGKTFTTRDEEYAQLLQALIAALKKPS